MRDSSNSNNNNNDNDENDSSSISSCGAISNDLKSTFGALNVILCGVGKPNFVRKTFVLTPAVGRT